MVVRFILDHFRRHVFKSAAESGPRTVNVLVIVHAPAEITDLDRVAVADQ